MDNVAVKDMLIYKTCLHDFDQSSEVCLDLLNETNADLNEQVQNEVRGSFACIKLSIQLTTFFSPRTQYAQFQIYEDLVQKLLPIFLAFYYGAWCDIFGRKYILYMYCVSRILTQALVVLNVFFIEWPKEYYLLSAVPVALAGGFVGYNTAVYSFLADISTPETLALRMAMLQLAESFAKPIGTQLGAFLIAYSTTLVNTSLSLILITVASFLLWMRIRRTKWSPTRAVST